jgi:hypothetical protein
VVGVVAAVAVGAVVVGREVYLDFGSMEDSIRRRNDDDNGDDDDERYRFPTFEDDKDVNA